MSGLEAPEGKRKAKSDGKKTAAKGKGAEKGGGAAENSAGQLLDYAFNPSGWAIKLPAGVTDGITFLNAREASSSKWTSSATKMAAANRPPWRESLELTMEEVENTDDISVKKYLLVGFTVRDLPDHAEELHYSQNKQRPVGTKLSVNMDNMLTSKELPIMVVTPVKEQADSGGVKLYALIGPQYGLCSPFIAKQTSVFYLPRFRDNTTAELTRRKNWNKLVQTQALRPTGNVLSAKQKQYDRAKSTSKVVLEPRKSLANEILVLGAAWAKSGETWHLEEFLRVLEHADKDLEDAPRPSYNASRVFLDHEDDEFDLAKAEDMVKELVEQWPDLKGMKAADLVVLKEQLLKHDLVVEFRLLVQFVEEACFMLSNARDAGVELDVAREALERVRRISKKREATTLSDGEDIVSKATLEILKQIVKSGREFEQKQKDNCGDLVGVPQVAWEKYAKMADTDAAKAAFLQAWRYSESAKMRKERGVTDMVENLVKVLDRATISTKIEAES